MLSTVDLNQKLSKSEFKERYAVLEKELIRLQRQIISAGIPVLITFEGWSTSGKGALINQLSIPMDPRGFRVYEGREGPSDLTYLQPFWAHSPGQGFISIFDRSWYRPGIEKMFSKNQTKCKYIKDALNFERHHLNSDALIIKFFLHISQEEQSSRLKKLTTDDLTSWRVNEEDFKQNFHYDEFQKAFDYVIEESKDLGKWEIIEAEDFNYAKIKVISTVIERFKEVLKSPRLSSADEVELKPLKNTDPFEEIDLSVKLSGDKYKEQFQNLGEELRDLGVRCFRSQTPIVIMYEGWDAAGKGGSIRRLTSFLDPRTYRVVPVAAPTKAELSRNYLWRFWRQMPEMGRMTIFDRSWYGRVLVERVEGFCRPDDWKRAYAEINEVEKHLVEQGVIVVKFWLEISPEEQLERFNSRLEVEHKKWKITDEDWRNREKWDCYKSAVDEMLIRTSTDSVPWTIVEGNNKQHARIKSMQTVVDAMKRHLADS